MPLVRVRENKQKDPQNKGFFVIVSKKYTQKQLPEIEQSDELERRRVLLVLAMAKSVLFDL